jgi:hypothetical protein
VQLLGEKATIKQDSVIRCECGTEIPLTPFLEEMGLKIEEHALKHKNCEKDLTKSETIFNHIQDVLILQVFDKTSCRGKNIFENI